MSVYEKIIQILNSKGVEYQVLEHEPTPTCADSARVRGTRPEQGAKSLICIADKRPIMIVLPCSQRLDIKKFKELYGVKDLRFATPEEIKNITGLEIGAIPPFGGLFGLQTYVSNTLFAETELAFNAGDRCWSIIMQRYDFEKIQKSTLGDF